MTKSKIIEMVKELADMGIIAQWYQDDFCDSILIEEWDITSGKDFERASAFVHKMKEVAMSIDYYDGMFELIIPDEEHKSSIDLIITCLVFGL